MGTDWVESANIILVIIVVANNIFEMMYRTRYLNKQTRRNTNQIITKHKL